MSWPETRLKSGTLLAALLPDARQLAALGRLGAAETGPFRAGHLLASDVFDAAEIFARAKGLGCPHEGELIADVRAGDRLIGLVYGDVDHCDECEGEGTVECNLGHDHDCPECDGIGTAWIDADDVMAALGEGVYEPDERRFRATTLDGDPLPAEKLRGADIMMVETAEQVLRQYRAAPLEDAAQVAA